MRITLSEAAVPYLTNIDCEEANRVMIQEFKNGNYCKGVILGLEYLAAKL